MTEVTLYRPILKGITGPDVDGAKRCVYHQLNAHNPAEGWWKKYEKMDLEQRRTAGAIFMQNLARAQSQLGVTETSVFGPKTLKAMYVKDRVDAVSEELFRQARPDPLEEKFDKLLAAMRWLSDHTPGYQLGGQHGQPLSEFNAYRKSDCSSSTSAVLHMANLWNVESTIPIVSGSFWRWGEAGPGKMFTVYYNYEHVWTRLHRTRYWRFDTSPHGDGGRGPKLRYIPRFSSSFQARHWPGM